MTLSCCPSGAPVQTAQPEGPQPALCCIPGCSAGLSSPATVSCGARPARQRCQGHARVAELPCWLRCARPGCLQAVERLHVRLWQEQMPLTSQAGRGRGEGPTRLCHRGFCPCTVPGPLQSSSFEEGIIKRLSSLLKMRYCLYQPQVMNLVASRAVNSIITKMSNKNKMCRASCVLGAINTLHGRGNVPVQTLVV